MALAFVDTEGGGSTNSGAITLTFSASLAENDVVYLMAATGDTDGVNLDEAMTTTGYTELFDLYNANTDEVNFAAFRKVMGVTPDTTAVIADSGGGSNAAHMAACTVWRGADTTTPEDATPTTRTNVDNTEPSPPDIVTVTADTVIVSMAAQGGSLDITFTAPTGYSNQIDGSADDTINVSGGVATIAFVGPGTHSPDDWTGFTPGAGDAGYAATIAIRPAGAGGRIWKLAGIGGGLVNTGGGIAGLGGLAA